MSKSIIAIDPGQSGAVAWNATGTLYVERLESGVLDFVSQICRIAGSVPEGSEVYMEDVGYGRPGTNVKAVTTFSRHCGQILGVLAALDLGPTLVTPQKWMSECYPDRPKGDGTKVVLRKMYILDETIKWSSGDYKVEGNIDINTADAVGILRYGLGR